MSFFQNEQVQGKWSSLISLLLLATLQCEDQPSPQPRPGEDPSALGHLTDLELQGLPYYVYKPRINRKLWAYVF